MKKLFNPYWILFGLTLPQSILFLLYVQSYQIIGTLLTDENLSYWFYYGLVGGGLNLGFTVYALYSIRRRHQTHPIYYFAVLLTYLPFLYTFLLNSEWIIPSTIPQWMLFQGDLILYVYTFTMPALFHAVFALVIYYSPRAREHQAWVNFLISLTFPVLWYLIFTVLQPLFTSTWNLAIVRHSFAILFIVSTVFFLFFLIRFLFILLSRYPQAWRKYDIIWKGILCVLFPILGLWLNQHQFGAFFGDFSAAPFYYLALLNGIFLCIPELGHPLARWLVFTLRSLTFPFIIYFFLVFLPFLPLSIPAIVAFGTGFLMLTPLGVIVIQTWILIEDYRFLRFHQGDWIPRLSFFIALVVLPSTMLFFYYEDRYHLHKALNYVHEQNYHQDQIEEVDVNRLANTLDRIRANKSRGGLFRNPETYQPYLSSLHNWLVLDNLTISDQKLDLLESVFLGKSLYKNKADQFQTSRPEVISLENIDTESTYDTEQGFWRTWVHLEIQNHTQNNRQEFVQDIDLPIGAYISNYYLEIEGQREYGILAEKKAARWVYQQIVNSQRDPGILYYLGGNRIALHIFPFLAQEKRKSGIEIIHREPSSLGIGRKKIALGKNQDQDSKILDLEDVYYVPAKAKSKLVKVQRTPKYYFIVDCSAHSDGNNEEHIHQITQFLARREIPDHQVEIILGNYLTQKVEVKENWHKKLRTFPKEGGFLVEAMIKRIALENYENPTKQHPVIIVVSDFWDEAIFTDDLGEFHPCFPESSLFYVLTEGQLSSYSLFENPHRRIKENVDPILGQTVLAFPNTKAPLIYLPVGDEAAIVPKDRKFARPTDIPKGKNWKNALKVDLMAHGLAFHPEQTEERWLPLVKASLQTQIMSPATSYIALENEAQKSALKAKQEQILGAKSSLDAGDEFQRMSEPNTWILLFILGTLWGSYFLHKIWKKLKQEDLKDALPL